MIQFVDYEPAHLLELKLQTPQAYFNKLITPEYARSLNNRMAWTGMAGNRIVGCAGIVEVWSERALVWALMAEESGQHMLAITRYVRRVLDLFAFRRVEAWVDPNFAPAVRWAEMLGFEREGYMRAFTPTGDDQLLYAQVRR